MNAGILAVSATLLLSAVLSGLASPQIGRGARPGAPVEAAPAAPLQPPPVTDPNIVLLTVSVTGPQNNAVAGLPKERFRIAEDGVEQQLAYFWEDSRPITVGFVLDDSERMGANDKVYVLKEAGASFLKSKRAEDEFFVVRLSDFADVAVSFTTDAKAMPNTYAAIGTTALYDGIHVALDVIKEGANPRKVLLVITSGGDRCCSDNNKTTTDQQLTSYALKQPVQIYSLFVVDQIADADSEFVHRDANLLNDLGILSGGRAYNAPNSARGVEALADEIARGLKTQYIVGYKSTNSARDGKRRGVRVRVESAEGSPKLSVWTKAGYSAPKARN